MGRLVYVIVTGGLVLALLGSGATTAAAQTGDLDAFCAARIEINGAETKKENLVVLEKLASVAPAEVSEPMTKLVAQFKKKGFEAYESDLVQELDGFIYENCPGNKVEFSAIDYEYVDPPATLPPGLANIKLTNDAPKEEHEIGIVKLLPAAEGMDIEKLLALPEKKQAKLVDFATGAFAPPGDSGYALTELEPGTYLYACFLHVGGKKKGAPHWSKGMYGTFEVQ